MTQILPSILAADFAHLADAVQAAEAGGATIIHVDVMDGHFVPNISLGVPVVASLRRVTQATLDVHLMISQPENYVAAFADAGADGLAVHVEATPHLHRVLQLIRDAGVKVGVALNPATPLTTISEVLDDIDVVLVMTVNPGFGGQTFIPASLAKIRRLRTMLDAAGRQDVIIEVDGGINEETLVDVVTAGAQWLVAGSAVYGSGDATERVRYLFDLAREAKEKR